MIASGFSSRAGRARSRGMILVIAVLVCFTLAATVLVLAREMRVESMAAANQAASVQAEGVERGAEQYLQALLATEGNDNIDEVTEDQFAAIQVGDGYFWVLRPDYDDPTLPVFGLVHEGAKLNLNTATYDQLMLLPGMMDDIAGAIVDWRDDDQDPSPSGNETYAKNAPFESVEEMMMIQAETPEYLRELLYGTGGAPPLGQVSTGSNVGFNGSQYTDPQQARGIMDLLTVWSSTPSITASAGGEQVIGIGTVSNSDLVNLRDLMLQKGVSGSRVNEILAKVHRNDRFIDTFEFAIQVGLTGDEFDLISKNIRVGTSASAGAARKGMIDVNAAPRDVLMCLGDGQLTDADVDKLIANRQTNNTPGAIGWVLTALGSKAAGLANQITGSSAQFSADILAVSGNGRAFKRVKIVIDNASGTPQIVFRRDLTDRGWPMDPQILASIRAGNGPGNWAAGAQMGTMGGGLTQ